MSKEYRAFCSWSGGKDSCLALYKALTKGIKVEYLFTMLNEDGSRSRGHGLRPEIMKKYSELLDIDYIHGMASWGGYEKAFKEKMSVLKHREINMGIFGDIDLVEHRQWVLNMFKDTGIEVFHPLWGYERKTVINEFVDSGFQSMINTVNKEKLSKKYLGRMFDKALIKELEELGVDPCGESGEFHTVVLDGPIFKEPLKLKENKIVEINQYWMLDLELE